MLDRAGDESAVERAVEHGGDQIGRRRGPQAEPYRRKAPVEFGEQRRQAHGGSGFHRADRERSLRLAIVARGQHRFARQRGHALRVGQQAAAGAGQRHAAAVPLEQRGSDLGLQRLYPLGDVGLHGVEFVRGAGDAAQPRHGRKRQEIGQFHGDRSVSILEMAAFSSIHFSRMIVRPNVRCPDPRECDADQHAIDRPPGHPAPDPAGADGRRLPARVSQGRERSRRVRHSRRRLRRQAWLEQETAKLDIAPRRSASASSPGALRSGRIARHRA